MSLPTNASEQHLELRHLQGTPAREADRPVSQETNSVRRTWCSEGEALKTIKDEGLIPENTVRLCVIGDGADWIWKNVQALFPEACQVLDYYYCAEYLHKVAYAQYGHTLQALEWVEATLTRLYQGHVGAGARWPAAHAANLGRGSQSDRQLLGSSP